MKTTSKIVAVKIAAAGARKMTDKQYSIIPPFGDDPRTAIVKHETSETEETCYYLTPNADGTFSCTCPFCEENGVCKHGIYLTEEIALQAWVDSQVQGMLDSYANAEY